jgi:hypothetical protein
VNDVTFEDDSKGVFPSYMFQSERGRDALTVDMSLAAREGSGGAIDGVDCKWD